MLKGIQREQEIEEIWNKVEDKCLEHNLKLLSNIKDYKNNKTPIKFLCHIHSKNENDYFEKNISSFLTSKKGCTKCGIESSTKSRRKNVIEIEREFLSKNMLTVDVNENNYVNKDLSLINFICLKHWDKGIQNTTYNGFRNSNNSCKFCICESTSSENHHSWKGGITPLQNYMRDKINPWKVDSFSYYNNTCIVTGTKNNKNIIHHLYGFNSILEEALLELKLSIRPEVNMYNQEELKSIEDLCLTKHYSYGFGVCVFYEIHNIFHKIYGKGNNTPSQWEDFITKIKYGEIKIPQLKVA